MIRVYSKEQIAEIAKKLGFLNTLRFEGFLAGDYDLFERRKDGIEDNAPLVDAEKEFFDSKIGELKNELAYNMTAPTKEQILKVIEMVKQLNIDYLLQRYQGEIDRETAENLVLYGYTHGNCNSLAYTLCTLFDECESKFFKCGRYGHEVVEFNGEVYDISGCSSIDEMKQFVASEGRSDVSECTITDCQINLSKQKLFDYAIMRDIIESREKYKQEQSEQ